MRLAFFDSHSFERDVFHAENLKLARPHEIVFHRSPFEADSAALAGGFPAICVFVNDRIERRALETLAPGGLKLLALRSAGYNHVDLAACKDLGIKVVRVPAYSPHAVAEHALTLLLALNRKIHRAYNRVRELDFSLSGLVGFDLHGKTMGIAGTGRIGAVLARISYGLGMRILAYDPYPNQQLTKEFGVEYLSFEDLCRRSDVITLQLPLNGDTHHIINQKSLSMMKHGVIIINTGRGGLIDTKALIDALKTKQVGGAGLDVYEEEEGIFFKNLSDKGIGDDTLARLLTFPNVVVTAHQAFLTREALHNIAVTTLQNVTDFEQGKELINEVKV